MHNYRWHHNRKCPKCGLRSAKLRIERVGVSWTCQRAACGHVYFEDEETQRTKLTLLPYEPVNE